jgi:capping protein beta
MDLTNNDHEKEEYSNEMKIKSCLHLARKMPVWKYKKAIEGITNLIYDHDDLLNEFLQKIDQPSEICNNDSKGEFLTCEYNRDGDSYRSPISNTYFPSPSNGDQLLMPSPKLRDMEVVFNKTFKEYTKLYYGGNSYCSCYIWNLEEDLSKGICFAVIIKNKVDGEKGIAGGNWDSANLIEVTFKNENDLIAKYALTTTVFFSASLNNKSAGNIEFSGSTTSLQENERIIKDILSIQEHVSIIGEMIESAEGDIRSKVEERNIKKSKEILDTARYTNVFGKPNIEGANKLKGVFANMK